MTRIQKERFSSNKEYEEVKNSYNLTINELNNVKDNFIILHPLPRVNEINTNVDSHKSAKYFLQVLLGMYMRMSLLVYCNNHIKNKNEKEYNGISYFLN